MGTDEIIKVQRSKVLQSRADWSTLELCRGEQMERTGAEHSVGSTVASQQEGQGRAFLRGLPVLARLPQGIL